MNKGRLLVLLMTLSSLGAFAQDCSLTLSGMSTKMANDKIAVKIGSNGRVTSITRNGLTTEILGNNGIYFDYTVENISTGERTNKALSPGKAEIIKNTPEHVEVLYSNLYDDILFQQGYILRKGVSGIYTYVICNGTPTSANYRMLETRVCTRTSGNFLYGYVDDSMQGKIPSMSEMEEAEKEENVVQDATYKLADGSIYTKYDWANYIARDSVHGLINTNQKFGIWTIPCSWEHLNGGPMRQELTVHATSKSPITIMTLQGEHFGAKAQIIEDGEKKLYGPFLIYVNRNSTTEKAIANAKNMAHTQMQEWPFKWFKNENYPLDRATVKGKINVTTWHRSDSIQVVLGEPDIPLYEQGGKYMYWALTDKDGNFTIKNVRKGDYALYAYATAGTNVDELEWNQTVSANSDTINLGTIDWTPVTYTEELWHIGENNRLADGFRYSDTLRLYDNRSLPDNNLTYIIGESNPAEDWYFAQIGDGTWKIKFNLDKKYSGKAAFSVSMAGVSNNPTLTVKLNGSTITKWSLNIKDGAMHRSAILGGKWQMKRTDFLASKLRQGENTLELVMDANSSGGIYYDCLKLEAGEIVTSIDEAIADKAQTLDKSLPVTLYTINGVKVGTYPTLDNATPTKGLYIYRQGSKTGKITF